MDKTETKIKSSKVKAAAKPAAKKAVKPKTICKIDPAVPVYKISVLINGQTFENETTSIQEALLELKPAKVTNKVIITVSEGSRKYVDALNVFRAKKVFFNKVAAEFFEKRVKLGLK
jgi:hypothetical protein